MLDINKICQMIALEIESKFPNLNEEEITKEARKMTLSLVKNTLKVISEDKEEVERLWIEAKLEG